MCHNDGHWIEVAFPVVESMCDCAEQCVAHPTATAFQFNADGFCGCLTIAGTDFATAVGSRQHIHSTTTACTLCNIERISANAPGQICPQGALPCSQTNAIRTPCTSPQQYGNSCCCNQIIG